MTLPNPVIAGAFAVLIYLLISGGNTNLDEKERAPGEFPFNNIKPVNDGFDEGTSSLGITDVNMHKLPKRFLASAYEPINVVKWKENWSTVMDNVVISNKPTKLISSPAATWNALQWDMLTLSEIWPVLSNVMLTENEGLHFSLQSPTDGMIGADERGPNIPDTIYEMSFGKFLYYSTSPRIFLSYSTNYRVMESLAHLESDTTWREFMVPDDHLSAVVSEPPPSADTDREKEGPSSVPSLRHPPPTWSMAHSGVVLQASFKEHHTWRVQLKGRGRYIILPPSKHLHMSLFPAIHVGSRQSQVLMEAGADVDPFPMYTSSSVQPMEVLLDPGQALYVPPYWMVRSEFSALSVFLDVNSLSRAQVLLATAQFVDVPLGNFSTLAEDRIVGAQSPKKYISRHYSSRYAALYPLEGLYMRKLTKNFQCHLENRTLYESVIARMDTSAIESTAQYVADIVNGAGIPAGVGWIWVGDYVDRIARWAMNDPTKAPLFLATCIPFAEKIPMRISDVPGPDTIHIGEKAVEFGEAEIVKNMER